MQSYRWAALLLLLLAISVPIGLRAMHEGARSQTNVKQVKGGIDKTKWPATAYDNPEPTDARSRSIRESRGKKFDNSMFRVHPLDPSDTTYLTHSGTDLLPALPIAQSDLILIGEVVDAKAYLSNDKTGVYSEFTVRVDEVLKSGGETSVAQNNTIAVERQGGRVQFPSGKEHTYFVSKENMPEFGQRYVLFLKRLEEDQAFHLLTGYVLIGDKVSPLDEHHQFETYKGAEAAAFIEKIKTDLSQTTP